MAKRKMELGLGRGLNSLLGDPELSQQESGSVTLPISQVEPGLNQPRKRFDPESLEDLAQSIRQHGIIQPLTQGGPLYHHRRGAPLAGRQTGGPSRGARHHHRSGRPQGDGTGPN